MQSVQSLVAELARRGISLRADGEQLRYEAAAGALTREDLIGIRKRKTEIIAFLGSRPTLTPVLRPREQTGRFPLSYSQEALVEAYERMTDLTTQHLCSARRLLGDLDMRALSEALHKLVMRHSAVRMKYLRDEHDERYVLIEDMCEVPVEQYDLSALAAAERERAAREQIVRVRARRFEQQSGLLLRAALLRFGAGDHVLALVVHHSVADAWSGALLMRDLLLIYDSLKRGDSSGLPPVRLQFSDYSTWLREWVESAAGSEQLAYWLDTLAGVRDPFHLPPDGGCESVSLLNTGNAVVRVDARALERVRQLAAAEGLSVQEVMLAAYAVALAAWSRADTVLIAVLHFGRQAAGLE
ncbi:MAG: condensation domain-containing protein, partial [Steroidobacteraceae bacterium]